MNLFPSCVCMGYLPLDIKQPTTGWTTYIIHPSIFVIENFIMAEIFQPSDKIKFIFILFQQRTCMIKARPKYPTDLYGTIYIDNIQKSVLCLIIPTIFPFGSSIKKYPVVWRTFSTLDPASKGYVVGMIRKMTTAFWILSM